MTPMIACNLKQKKKTTKKKNDFRAMPFKGLAFFADVKRKVVKTHRNFYTSLCLFFVLENFRIRFISHAKMKVFFINLQVT